MYTLEQLKTFALVCECGSLSAAARQLGRAQSGISQAIANLEIALDQTLFVREKAGITLTDAGQALLPAAQAVLRQARQFDQKLHALARGQESRLKVAIEESLWSHELMDTLARLVPLCPQTQLELITAATFDIEALVARGQVQLGVAYKDYNVQKDLDFFFLGYHRFITVAAPSHPLAALRGIDPPTLAQHRHLAHRSVSGQELWFSSSLAEQCWWANDHQTLLQLALRGVGWADLPEKMAQAELQRGALKRLDLAFEPHGNLITVVGLRSRAHLHGQASQQLTQLLQDFFTRQPPAPF